MTSLCDKSRANPLYQLCHHVFTSLQQNVMHRWIHLHVDVSRCCRQIRCLLHISSMWFRSDRSVKYPEDAYKPRPTKFLRQMKPVANVAAQRGVLAPFWELSRLPDTQKNFYCSTACMIRRFRRLFQKWRDILTCTVSLQQNAANRFICTPTP
jgi:hypothetical protein